MTTSQGIKGVVPPELTTNPLDYAVAARDANVYDMVRLALAENRTALAFQPSVSAKNPRQVAFYEGLVRVLDETGRPIPARQFMGDIEERELGRDIDAAALRLGLETLLINPSIRLSINVSARSLGDSAWRREMERGLHNLNDMGDRLILEISERSAMQLPEVVVRFMEEMQPRGVAFALDDFGGGMTSFKHLKEFFFDMVKIDPTFVRGVHESPDNQVLAEALTTVAQQFEMFAVAPGIESREEAAFMTDIGVDCLQGYYISPPRMEI